MVLQLKRIGEAQAIAGCTEQQVTRLEQRIGQECDIFFARTDMQNECMEANPLAVCKTLANLLLLLRRIYP